MERIGFVGLGTMGTAMAANLLRAEAPLTVWNRTASKGADLAAGGARSGRRKTCGNRCGSWARRVSRSRRSLRVDAGSPYRCAVQR